MNKQIAGALVASLLIGSAPGWAQENATAKPTVEENTQRQQFRDSIDRAIGRSMESEAREEATPVVVVKDPSVAGPQLTAHERRDLDKRRAALQTNPVARGTGGIILALVGVAVSIGVTVWAIHHYSEDDNTTTAMVGRR